MLTAADVGVALSQGDAQAVQLIRDSGRRVGQVLATPGLVLQPRPDRHRRPRHRPRARPARRDPRGDLPPLAPARHRQPADRAERAGRRGRGHRCRPPDQQLRLRAARRRPRVTLVAGVDSSTQSCKVVVRDADTGRLVRSGRARPSRRHRGRPGRLVDGPRVGGQRRPAGSTTWPRSRSAASSTAWSASTRTAPSYAPPCSGTTPGRPSAAADLVDELGGGERGGAPGPRRSASVPVASFTVTKLRWLAEHEPEHARALPPCACPTTG